MQITKAIILGLLFSFRLFTAQAQSDSAIASQHALTYADSMVKAYYYHDWNVYMDLSCYSAIKYYGGKDAFKEHVVMIYYHNEPVVEEKPEKIRMVNLMNDIDEWQCVIEKVRETRIENRKARVISYLVGQSTDNGEHWKFIDISHNSIENVIYIMPKIFGNLAIPEGKTIFEDEAVAQQEPEMASVNSKPTYKRHK